MFLSCELEAVEWGTGRVVACRFDLVPGQGVLVGTLTLVVGVSCGWENNVGDHTLELIATPAHAEELGNGGFQTAMIVFAFLDKTIQVDHVLHRALAKGWFTNNDATVVVLYRTGEDFRGGGAVAINQYGQRSGVDNTRFRIVVDIYTAGGVLGLNDRATVNKQSG